MSVFPWLISSADNKLVSWSYHASMSLLTGLITQWMGICFLRRQIDNENVSRFSSRCRNAWEHAALNSLAMLSGNEAMSRVEAATLQTAEHAE